MLTGLCRRLVMANCKSSVVTRSLLGTSSSRFFSSSSSGDDESGKLPEGFTEAELLKFLSDPEREDSPFQRVKVGQTSFNTQTHQRYGDGTPSSSSLSSSSSSPSSADSSFLPEEVINSSQTPEDVRETILNQLASRPLRPGDIYDPLSLLENDGMSMDSVSFRTQRRGTRPSRLVVTGKELHFTNVWLLSRFLTPLGRIMPRWKTGLSPKKQRKLAAAVKRARQMGLLPYLHKYEAGILDQAPGEMERNPLAAPLKPEKQSHKQQQKENAAEQKEVSPSQEKLAE